MHDARLVRMIVLLEAVLGVALDAVVENGEHVHGQGVVRLVHLLNVEEDLPEEAEEVAHHDGLGHAAERHDEDLVQLGDRLAQLETVVRRHGVLPEEDVHLLEVVDRLPRETPRELDQRRGGVLGLADVRVQPVNDRLQGVLGLDHHGDGFDGVGRLGRLRRLDLLVDGLEEEAEDALEELRGRVEQLVVVDRVLVSHR